MPIGIVELNRPGVLLRRAGREHRVEKGSVHHRAVHEERVGRQPSG